MTEDKWQAILLHWAWDQHPYLLFALAPDGKIMAANEIAHQRTGFGAMELHGRHYTEIADQRGPHYIGRHPFAQVIAQKKLVQLEDKIGPRYYRVHYTPCLGSQGEVNGVIVSMADFTELAMVVRTNAQLQDQMYHAAKLASMGELAAGVGHEINNPLAVLSGHSYLFEMKYQKNALASEDLEKLIRVQKEAVARIKGIVDSLRTYSRMDSEEVQALDLNLLVQDTLQFLHSLYLQEGIEIRSDLWPGEVMIAGNTGRLQQVLVNLISNAKDACAQRLIKVINISSAIDRHIAVLKIQDNGEGISSENLQKIFNPFFTTKDVGKGTGLGLKIVKNVVEKSGGIVNIESELGVGTTIEIRLPLQKVA